jgi:hypothetical protein
MNRNINFNSEEMIAICKELPFFKFPPEWEVSIIPPYLWAVSRFVVKYNEWTVSIYLDLYNYLGFMNWGDNLNTPIPYYEIYPNAEGDTSRFTLAAVQKDPMILIKAIQASFDSTENKP